MDFPDDADGQSLRRVAESGNDLSRPMVIDFIVAAPNEAAADAVGRAAADCGFEVELSPDDEAQTSWTVVCKRNIVATYDALIAFQGWLDALAQPHGGHADGWGTFGNAPDSRPN